MAQEPRGPKYPSDSLSTAVELLRKLKDGVGFGLTSREQMAIALGYPGLNGTSSRRVAVLNHFNLVERSGTSYRISDLGKRILVPKNDAEYQTALVEAAKSPQVFGRLWQTYSGQALPSMLTNIVVRELGAMEESAPEIVRVFKESAEFAGLLRNGILLESPDVVEEAIAGEAAGAESLGSGEPSRMQRGVSSTPAQVSPLLGPGSYTIPLSRSGRSAEIRLPIPFTQADLDRIRAWLTYMDTMAQENEQTPEIS